MDDARFEDVGFSDKPLRLGLQSAEDVPVVSALLQDAVGLVGEISWMPRRRRLAVLVNRFRWEDRAEAERMGRKFERVRSALIMEAVEGVQANGLDPREKDMVYSILQMTWVPTDDPAGRLEIALAGDGALGIIVECIEGQLVDLTRPWQAASDAAPNHSLDD